MLFEGRKASPQPLPGILVIVGCLLVAVVVVVVVLFQPQKGTTCALASITDAASREPRRPRSLGCGRLGSGFTV